jgi:regulator of sigma E protease
MQSIPSDIVVFIAVLGILVFVHEFGHYAVAKLFKIRVEVFSLGFGKRLFGFRRGDTDYRISLLPLGGYVKMAGENPLEARTGDPGEFMSHPRWQRFLIAIAGPAMNILLAVVMLTGLYTVHYEPSKPAEIGWVLPGSPADLAGIKSGDKIVKIEDIQNPNWEKTDQKIMLSPDERVDISVQRGDQVIATTIKPRRYGPEQIGDAGWDPQEPALIGSITSGFPAEKAGIKAGDTIISLNDKPVRNVHELIRLLQDVKNKPIEITTVRDAQELKFNLTPVLGDAGDGTKTYQIGIRPGYKVEVLQLPFRKAFAAAYADSKDSSGLIFLVVGKMLQHKVSIKQMSGPVGIMRYSGEAYRLGLSKLVKFMALISLNLAIFNLLPIPILDGGLMLMLLVEGIMRRDIRQDVKERVYQAAFVFLVIFAAVVIFNDVSKLPGISHFRQ